MKVTTIDSLTMIRHGYVVHIDNNSISVSIYMREPDMNQKGVVLHAELQDGSALSPMLAGQQIGIYATSNLVFEDLLNRTEHSDYAIWTLPATADQFGHPFNRVVETTVSKRHKDHQIRLGENAPIKLLVPLQSADPSDWTLHVATNPDYPLICNAQVERLGLYETIARDMPTMSAPAEVTSTNGAPVEIEVTFGNAPAGSEADVFAETSGGYLPLTRIRSTGHKAKFRLLPLGLNAGESVRIKFGFRHYSGLAATTVRVA